jgi:hypothetical protein
MNNKPVGGPSSETYSHHIDIIIRQFEVSESSIPYKTAVTGKFFIIKNAKFSAAEKSFLLTKMSSVMWSNIKCANLRQYKLHKKLKSRGSTHAEVGYMNFLNEVIST